MSITCIGVTLTMTKISYKLSDADELVITEQLGRKPRGIVNIAARDHTGLPLVLTMRSWVGNAPFPTLYWLSSKDLHKAINKIETAGFVKELEMQIECDEALKQQLLEDQKNYHQRRSLALLPEDKQAIDKAGLSDTFNQFGIGGIKQWDKVRCLHMHYAYHLALKAEGKHGVVGSILDCKFQLNEVITTI